MSKEAMKLALDALKLADSEPGSKQWERETEAIVALGKALAEQPAQQEPVAWIVEDQIGERLEWASDAHSCHGVPTFPLYTSPPAQRKPLTDDELDLMCEKALFCRISFQQFARSIEAAHGIKEQQ